MQKLQHQMNIDRRWDSIIEITRYTRAIAVLNDRYGWHLDAQKVLSKLGKKLGKKCGGGWISPEKRCKSHYTNGKLNESGKASGENLADRIRQRKKLSTVSRNGKGQELAYAFLPGNQKQSTMTARRTHAPKSGYQTPGRLAKTSSTEERRSMVGLGQSPWIKQQPDSAPMMDRTPRVATPIKSGGSIKSLNAESELVAKASGAASISEPQTRKLNATVPRSTAGDRIRAVAKSLEDESKIQKGATVGILESAEKLYVNQNKMIKEVAGMVNEDLDRAAAKGVRKVFDPTQTPVRIPNQRSSKEPRQRGRSVD